MQKGVALLDRKALQPVGLFYSFRVTTGRVMVIRLHSVQIYLVRIQRWLRRRVLPFLRAEHALEREERVSAWQRKLQVGLPSTPRIIYI